MIVVIPCGAKKRAGTWPAYQLYTGAYFLACLRYALSIAPKDSVYILSAKYGLVPLENRIASYDVVMGDPGSVDVVTLTNQAQSMKILDEKHVLAIGGKRYVRMCKALWPLCKTLPQCGEMGKQMHWLKIHRGLLP